MQGVIINCSAVPGAVLAQEPRLKVIVLQSWSSDTLCCQGKRMGHSSCQQGTASHHPVLTHTSDLVLLLPRALQGRDLHKVKKMHGHSQGTRDSQCSTCS